MRTDHGYFDEKKLGKSYDIRLIRRLVPYAGPYRIFIFGSILLVICISLLDLSIPYITKIAIDRYIVPTENTAKDQAEAAAQNGSRRFIAANLKDPGIRRLVDRYPQLFISDGDSKKIAIENVSALDPADAALLRREDLAGLKVVAVMFLGVIALNFIFNFAQRWIMEFTGHMIMHNLRVRLYDHIQGLSIDFFTRNPVGRLVTRVTNDIQNMHELFTSVVSFIFKDLFLLFGIAAVLVIMNWKLALATFVVIPVVGWAAAVFSSSAREIFRLLRIKIAEINTRFSETISGIRVIQLFRNENHNYRSFSAVNHENYLVGMRQIRVLGIFLPLVEVLGVVAVAIVIYYGGGRVLEGVLTLGSLVAFISYMKMFFRPIRDLAEKYNILQNAMSSAERIFLILDTTGKRDGSPDRGRFEISEIGQFRSIAFEDVHFNYVADEPVLKNINLCVRAGETIGVVGPTGSGKTTLINLITGFYDPTAGRVLLNGEDLRRFSPASYRSKMALVMQDPFLFSETIRNNIFRGNGHFTEEEVERILKLSNCNVLTERLPAGPDTVLAEGGLSISSGERQLISIARAFARNPQLILFDEATSYIDSQTEVNIQEALENLMRERTAIIVAHRLSTVRNVDQIVVLNRGVIVETGSHAELMDRRGFYYRLHQVQR